MKFRKGIVEKPTELKDPDNTIVYLDLQKGLENVGRVIIELYKHAVPSTAENFRALCTGEMAVSDNGVRLHYKGTKFHKLISHFMIQGGDIVNFDGSSGYSIYGPKFELENFTMLHDVAGTLSMVNVDEIYCNSQFIITNSDCPHLNGQSVAFGRVIKGFSCVQELCGVKTTNDIPTIHCQIQDCGELLPGDDWKYGDNDDTADRLPHGPDDLEIVVNDVEADELVNLVNDIAEAAKFHFKIQNFVEADRKYRKCLRYIAWIENYLPKLELEVDVMKELVASLALKRMNCHLNLSATKLTLADFKQCIYYCDKVLSEDESNVKAWFRKGKALFNLKEYDEALESQRKAQSISPSETCIAAAIKQIQQSKSSYVAAEKRACAKMFDFNK